jgi:putative DNA primase/helicase
VSAPNAALGNIPVELKAIPNWVAWKIVNRDGQETKPPFVPGTSKHASSTNPATWTDFDTAIQKSEMNGACGIGFVIGGRAVEQGFIGIDIDGCRDPKNDEIFPWAKQIIEQLNSYTEVTPSRTGVRVWVRGSLPPDGNNVFNLDPSIGYGDKVKVEVYDRDRYFTVTGDTVFDPPGGIESSDLNALYKILTGLRAEHPATGKLVAEAHKGTASLKPSVQLQRSGTVMTNKFKLLMDGEIVSDKPFVVADDVGNSIEYASASEADMALCTLSAMKHGAQPDLIWKDYTESCLVREKWTQREEDFRKNTIAKAIESAAKCKIAVIPAENPNTLNSAQSELAAIEIVDDMSEAAIPPFDPTVMNGIYAKFVELVTRGTTLAPQFAFVIAKTVVGLRMAGKVRFDNLDVEPRLYTALIGETGSGKGEAWRRAFKILRPEGASIMCKMKIINSADSGAGLKDCFFEFPQEEPLLCYVDEIESLGNKSKDTRNPAILDTMIELADSTSISRVLAAKKGGGNKTKHDARFAMVMCGQDGSVYTKAMAGRAKLGMYDRLYPEFGTAVEAGDIPPVDTIDAIELLAELNSLDYSGTMSMSKEAKSYLDDFWQGQPANVRKKARFKKNLYLDSYMSAFGRGIRIVEEEDAVIAIKIFTRQLIIRRVCFSTEVPDRVGYYLGCLKNIHAHMVKQLKMGTRYELVALSQRDFETKTHAFRGNEEHIFARAWQVFRPVHLMPYKYKRGNGQLYEKWLPAAEYWLEEDQSITT